MAEISRIAHDANALLVVDGCQGAIHMPVDVQAFDVDFYVFSAHKLYGPNGVGILWGKTDILAEMPPFLGGGDMIEEVHYDKATWAPVPHKFEAGTPPYVEAIGLGAAIDYLTDLDMENVQNHSDELREYGKEIFADIDKINIIHSSAEKAGCTFGMYVDNVHATDLSLMLDTHGVAVRSGHHCVQPFHRKLGIDATIIYALGGDRELTLSDLDVDSPYNTRKVVGLPPTPISAPGQASIEAALNPAVGDWLFYVRTDNFGTGSHTFTVTEADFNEAVQVCIERDLGCG